MKNLLFLVSLMTIIYSCSDDDTSSPTCANPEETGWLKTEINTYKAGESEFDKYAWIKQAVYQDEPVFIFGNCCPTCNSVFIVKNCAGESFGILSSDCENADAATCIEYSMISNEQVIWSSSECSF